MSRTVFKVLVIANAVVPEISNNPFMKRWRKMKGDLKKILIMIVNKILGVILKLYGGG